MLLIFVINYEGALHESVSLVLLPKKRGASGFG